MTLPPTPTPWYVLPTMVRIARLTRNGNSLALIIPRSLLATLRWNVGDLIRMDVVPDGLFVQALELPPAKQVAAPTLRAKTPRKE